MPIFCQFFSAFISFYIISHCQHISVTDHFALFIIINFIFAIKSSYYLNFLLFLQETVDVPSKYGRILALSLRMDMEVI